MLRAEGAAPAMLDLMPLDVAWHNPVLARMTERGPMGDADAELMARVAARDDAAFAAVVERHAGKLLGLAQSVMGRAAEADEIVQEALLRVWTQAGRYDPDRGSLATWLHRIVVNLCLDRLRRVRPATLDDDALAVPDPSDSAFDQLAMRECREQVQAGLARMPPRQRLALVLFHFQDLDLRAGAAAMDLSPGAFEALLRRARRTLKDILVTSNNGEGMP